MSLTNRMLGYPDDARLLIVNADDFGMSHAANVGIMRAFQNGIVRSTSLMAACPWAWEAMRLLRETPELAFGIHLTLVCEAVDYRWGPLAAKDRVPSLVDETGLFYSYDRIPTLLAEARLDELEIEFRAQIERVLAAGLKPAHLDWHCLRNGGRDDIFELSLALAHEYGLAIRTYDPPWNQRLQSQGLPTDDHPLLDSYALPTDGKAAHYAQLLRELPPGLSEWAVHPAINGDELQAIEPESWGVRDADYRFVTSPEAQALIQAEGIILLDYRPLQAVWNVSSPRQVE